MLICTANSTGGVMGKMIDAQSICVATAATHQIGSEADIFKAVIWHSIFLACDRRADDAAAGVRVAVHLHGAMAASPRRSIDALLSSHRAGSQAASQCGGSE